MTRAATATPRALHAYLRRATWGLSPARQQELWDELEEHVLTRAEQLQCAGAAPQAALSQALAELGPPGRVALGMTQVYAMPKLLIAAGTIALGVSAALYALAGGREPVFTVPVFEQSKVGELCVADLSEAPTLALPVISRAGGKICYQVKSSRDLTLKPALISAASAEQVLGAIGGALSVRPDGMAELRLAGGTWSRSAFAFNDGTKNYILASALLDALLTNRNFTQRVTLRGFQQPVLALESLTVKFVSAGGDKLSNSIYSSLTGEVIADVIFNKSDAGFSFDNYPVTKDSPRHRVRTNLPPGEVVILVNKIGGESYSTDFSVVGTDGIVELRSNAAQLRFVSNAQALASKQENREPALLVRVTNVPINDFRAGIFVPAQATSDAR